jgi:hypothetical protein
MFLRLACRVPRVSGMKNSKLGRAIVGMAAAATLTFLVNPASAAEAPADRVLSPDRYTSDKGRALGQKYQGTLRDLNAKVYTCMPWLDVKTEGIGFYKPKHIDGDVRYLSLNVNVDQQPAPEFTKLSVQDRVSSMFSRYVPHLLRSMATNDLLKDPNVEGFTIITSWLKADPSTGQPAVMETSASFVPKSVAVDFLRGKATITQLAEGSHVIAWDGETKLGQVKTKAWADDFVLTYKVAGYTPDPKVSCQ